MKILKLHFTILAFIICTSVMNAQKEEKQNITSVEFTGTEIILNKKHAFNYEKSENNFQIKSLENKTLITGNIITLGENKWRSHIIFLTINKEFTNQKIIGRNDLIFALCENNVITKNFEIDDEKLKLFISKYNEL